MGLNGIKLGTPQLGAVTDISIAIGVEALLNFFLVFTVFATGVDRRGTGQIAGFAIGFVLIFDILVGGPLTGAAMNPARAFGTAAAIFHFPLEHIVYWIGPIIGGIVAGLVYGYGLLKRTECAFRALSHRMS
jgi:glycerol uptake facilitator-like aquaporin